MPQVKIGLVQMCCEKGAIASNTIQMEAYIQEAIREEADFLCFPEMNITGYVNPALYPHVYDKINIDQPYQIVLLEKLTT
jgi:predicted amidohydrolase